MKTAYAISPETAFPPGDDRWVEALGIRFRGFLEQVRARLAPLSANDGDDVLAVKELEPWLDPPFHRFVRLLNDVPRRVPAERLPALRRRLQEVLHPLLMPAPIFREWLAKWTGDRVTVDIAEADRYRGDTAYAKCLNRMLCELSISRGAISRLDYLRRWIDWTVRDSAPRVRILSVGCGPAREIREYLAASRLEKDVLVSLLDRDAHALAFAHRNLAAFSGFGRRARIETINATVEDLVREPARFADLAGQHLIYAPGIFDHLTTDAAISLVRALFRLVAPGGNVVVANLSPRCDSRGFVETLLGWQQVYRTDRDLLDLAYGVPATATIERDATGASSFLVLRRG